MKKDSKQRLFEVMGRLDKTFKPKLNEDFEVEDIKDDEETVDTPADISTDVPVELPDVGDEEPKELSADEKLEALTAKIDSLYAMVHGDEKGEEEAEAEEEEIEGEPEAGEEEVEDEIAESKPSVPVNAVPKVGK